MTIEELIKTRSSELIDNGYIHGEREVNLFLAHILDKDSGSLFAHYEESADEAVINALDDAIRQRLSGSPVAYITGDQPFMGWKLISDSRALIPRPETELLVEELIRDIKANKLERGNFLEIGTGAGPIALALKKYFPQATIVATDVSEEALELASENARRLKVDVEFIQSDLFENVPKKKYDVIVANLPYVPTERLSFVSDQILDWEPMIAIEAGEDGLLYIKPYLEQLSRYLKKDGVAAIEFWHTHADPVQELAEQFLQDYEIDIRKDLAGYDRYAFFLPR
jgi:release factor glutamine methyltransferase